MPDVIHFAHQPIVDRRGRVVCSEVLFRADELSPEALIGDAVAATRHVLGAIGRYRGAAFENRPTFVNMPRQFILDGTVALLDPQSIGVEILEDVEGDADVLHAVAGLRRAGFLVALDDFVPEPSRTPLLAYADIVKLDVRAIGFRQLSAIVDDLRRIDVLLLAEKVETETELGECLEMGFDLFQGYAVGRPKTIAVSVATVGDVLPGVRWTSPWIGRRPIVDPVSP